MFKCKALLKMFQRKCFSVCKMQPTLREARVLRFKNSYFDCFKSIMLALNHKRYITQKMKR